MSNDLTPREPGGIDDDGFHGSPNSGRLLKGSYLKWTDANHWIDRDGLAPPSPLLVIAIDEALQRWKDNKADVIRDKPLPDPEELNSTIPTSEWERGNDGQLRKPWAHVVIVYLVNPTTGEIYTYTAPTIGAHIAYDTLNEAVTTMRVLRGTRVLPVVSLSERPMKTNFGMRRRPHFEIIGWKTPGDDTKAVATKPASQLSGPTLVPQETPPAPTPPAASTPATPSPVSNPAQPYQAKPKPPVKLANETLEAMGNVKPVTTSEILNDELPW
jgi:hypothetical protein